MTLLLELLQAALVFTAVLGVATGCSSGGVGIGAGMTGQRRPAWGAAASDIARDSAATGMPGRDADQALARARGVLRSERSRHKADTRQARMIAIDTGS